MQKGLETAKQSDQIPILVFVLGFHQQRVPKGLVGGPLSLLFRVGPQRHLDHVNLVALSRYREALQMIKVEGGFGSHTLNYSNIISSRRGWSYDSEHV